MLKHEASAIVMQKLSCDQRPLLASASLTKPTATDTTLTAC